MTNKTFSEVRDEMIAEVSGQIAEHEKTVEESAAAARAALKRYLSLREMQDQINAQAAHNDHRTHLSKVDSANHQIKQLKLEFENIVRGSHPALATLSHLGQVAANKENLNRLQAAKAEYFKLLTPEIKVAAQNYLDAAKRASPLNPPDNLASILVATIN